MNLFKNFFGKKEKSEILEEKEITQEDYERDYELKSQGLEAMLGKMHRLVGHAIIPFEVGGAVDMYYFLNHIKGTGFATMELLDPLGNGPLPNKSGTYELVAFTKEEYNESKSIQTEFNKIERRICGIFTNIGNYSFQAVLNPNETCEIPSEEEENKCLVFDIYQPGDKEFKIGDKTHHLLLCLEIFRSEMEFARENSSAELFSLLKEKGIYPYSDLNREPVV